MLGDLAMIINDPYCTNTLLTNIFNLLTEIVDQGIDVPLPALLIGISIAGLTTFPQHQKKCQRKMQILSSYLKSSRWGFKHAK